MNSMSVLTAMRIPNMANYTIVAILPEVISNGTCAYVSIFDVLKVGWDCRPLINR